MINPYEYDTEIGNPRYHALKQACKSGVLSTVRSVHQAKNWASLDLRQPEPLAQRHYQKCLFEAFTNSNFDVARYLIREAGVEMKEVDALLAWHASRTSMPVQAFEFLIQEGWNINTPVFEFQTALSYVLPSLPLTKWFLEHGANPNLGPDAYRRYSKGAAMVSNSGHVLGRAACTNPATAITLIDLLVQYGARLEDSIPLHLLAECGPYQSRDQLNTSSPISYSQAQSSLDTDPTSTLSSSRIPILQYLLDLGYDPNASDMAHQGPHGNGPPLHWAVRRRLVENTRFLLENGADPWGKNRCGQNALEASRSAYLPAGESELEKVIKEFM